VTHAQNYPKTALAFDLPDDFLDDLTC